MTMHRIRAGTPDAAGQFEAISTLGKFRVVVPLPFNDYTVADADPASDMIKTFSIGTKSSEGIKFVASRVVYRRGGTMVQQHFAQAAQMTQMAGAPVNVRRLRVGDFAALEFEAKSANAVLFQRMINISSGIIVLQVEAPSAFADEAQRFMAPFFESLRVLP
jgi:hypothetical protein